MIMKDCTGIICKMKTYKELKEQVINEQDFATPRQEFMSKTINPVMGKARSGLAKVGDFAKNNKGLVGGLAVGALGLASLAGIFRSKAPKEVSTKGTVPSPDLQVTKATDAPTTLGVPVKRVSHAAKKIDPSVKPIDNRTTMSA